MTKKEEVLNRIEELKREKEELFQFVNIEGRDIPEKATLTPQKSKRIQEIDSEIENLIQHLRNLERQ